MAATYILLFSLWVSTAFTTGLICPQLCTCSVKYSRLFADCSYKELDKVPEGFPPSVATISLSANKISVLLLGTFDNVTRLISLWMSHNEIVSIEQGALVPLVHLQNLDISHNKIVDFPWEDLQNLTGLYMLKMNHNEMVSLPMDAFSNLKDLKSLRLNNNRFVTIAEGTFEGLLSLSHLQIYNNPFACTCSLEWFRVWISTTTISLTEHSPITCATPEKFKGMEIRKLPETKCTSPNVTVWTEPDNAQFYEGSKLVLTCDFKGNPKPLVLWSIHSKSRKQELALLFAEEGSAESSEDSSVSYESDSVKVFNNGTLLVSNLRKEDGGNYSCSATNELGRAEDSVLVEVMALSTPIPTKQMTTVPSYTKTNPSTRQETVKASAFNAVQRKKITSIIPTHPPTADSVSEPNEDLTKYLSSKCGLTANTSYISSPVSNGSLDDIKYMFDFGVIALGVSETQATVRLNPLLMARQKGNQAADATSDNKEHHGLPDSSEKAPSNGLYLCVTADLKHSAVQWSKIRDGVNSYQFSGLRPGTNYSLCLTYRGEDCEVHVLFTTRRKVPNLFIIISVSICLLTVSTVPLLGATCFHLVYKYRSKTYKLILKAKDQYHIERNLTTNFNIYAPHAESLKKIDSSQLDGEEDETESGDGDKEADTEESVVTDSFTLSQCRGNLDDCEVGSEYSDRLSLGAEAVNITTNYKYPSQ